MYRWPWLSVVRILEAGIPVTPPADLVAIQPDSPATRARLLVRLGEPGSKSGDLLARDPQPDVGTDLVRRADLCTPVLAQLHLLVSAASNCRNAASRSVTIAIAFRPL